jgi:hypothetical protein
MRKSISIHHAQLIINYTHRLLSEPEGDELDEWICENDDNLEVFETLISDVADKMINPEDLIDETDDILEVWVITGLIARERVNELNEVEKEMLDEWIASSEKNERLYKALSNPANFQQFIEWFRQMMRESDTGIGLN